MKYFYVGITITLFLYSVLVQFIRINEWFALMGMIVTLVLIYIDTKKPIEKKEVIQNNEKLTSLENRINHLETITGLGGIRRKQ